MKLPRMPARSMLALICLVWLCTACGSASDQSPQAASPVQIIQDKGSDTIVNLALAWAEKYQGQHPEVNISVTGGGTGTGFTSLINGTADIANASRAIKDEEKKALAAKGVVPQEFVVARDAIAVVVNPANPVSQLSLQQVADIFSGKIDNWKEVGGEDRQIVRLSRETNSGTHVYFLQRVLRMNDSKDKTLFSADTLLLPSSVGIIQEVQDNPNAIGYDGLGYVTPEVKVLALADKDSASYVLPSAATVTDHTYPVSRDLYMYTAGKPTGLLQKYLEWIYSADAQAIVKELGFVPVQGQ